MALTFKGGYAVYSAEDQDELIFTNLDDIRDYFDLTPSQLNDLRWENECPDGLDIQMMNCTIVQRKRKKTAAAADVRVTQEVLYFKTSKDGNHWERDKGHFSSIETIIDYVRKYLAYDLSFNDDDIRGLCQALKKDWYAKWVNPDDKTDKLYILIESIGLDPDYE